MGVHLQSWLSTDLRPDKLIMQKNYEQNTATGWHYQAQEASQSYAQSPQLPPSYDQATYVHSTPPTVEPTTTTQVVIIQRRFIAVSFCVALAFLFIVVLLLFIAEQTQPAVGPDPCFISCPHCHVQKLTRVEYAPSVRTHCMAALLCIVGQVTIYFQLIICALSYQFVFISFSFPCSLWCFACIPYCATSCMNANHFCGNCNQYVGVYSSD